LFSSGYNMYKKQFFTYILYICIFGVVSTLITYTIFSGLTYVSLAYFGELEKYNFITGETSYFTLQTREILLMCSLLCSTDVVAAISIVKYKEQPKLFSMIFGEGIINDAVCIILFNTVILFTSPEYEISYWTPLEISFSFVYLALMSLVVGTILGLLSSLMFKQFRIIAGNPIHETALLFLIGYLAYVLAEYLGLSGIISMLASGITMA